MNALLIAGTVLACTTGGVAGGMFLRRYIPESHLITESQEGIKLGVGIVATMAALVLGLLISGAKSSFDAQTTGFQLLATNVILLDRTLAHYGDEAQPARARLRTTVAAMIDRIWPTDGARDAGLADASITSEGGALYDAIHNLVPSDDTHRGARAHALQLNSDLARARWQLTHRDNDSLPMAFLIVLLFWFLALFTCLGAVWGRNTTVVVVFVICGLAVASAMFLIVDLDQPFEGLIQVSKATLTDALAELGK